MGSTKAKRVFLLGAGVGKCMDIPLQDNLFEAIMKFNYRIIDSDENHYSYESDKEAISYFLRRKKLVDEKSYPGIEKVLKHIHKASSHREVKNKYDKSYLERYFNINNMLYDYLWHKIRNGGREKRLDGVIPRESIQCFAEKLSPEDIIINFNYDVVIEDSLDVLGKLWSYEEKDKGIRVFKVHGSINWVRMNANRKISYKSSAVSPSISGKVKNWFKPLGKDKKCWVVKSPDGGRLLTTYLDLTKGEFTKGEKWGIPSIIPPVRKKYADIHNDLKQIVKITQKNAWKSIKNAEKLFIIGYSFRKEDKDSWKAIVKSLKKNKDKKRLKISFVNPSFKNIKKDRNFRKKIKKIMKLIGKRNCKKIHKTFEKWVKGWK